VVEELIDDGPVKSVVPPSPIKVTTEYESGDDDLIEQVRADRTVRELAAVNAARRGEVLYRGYPQVTMSKTNELVVESMNLAQWADIYCHYALHEGFEVKETRKAMLTFNILLNMTENLQESQGKPLTSRSDFPKVDYADTAYVAYLDAKEEAINEAAIANKRRREVSNTYYHSSNFLTTLSSYDYKANEMPTVGSTTQKVGMPGSIVNASSNSSESSVVFESNKRIKLNSLQYAISHQANVIVCKYAYLARSDLYDTIVDSGATCHIINDTKYATHEFNFTPANPEDGVRIMSSWVCNSNYESAS
jgi:hypothetical protein